MPGPEDFIERCRRVAVINLEVFVVQLMKQVAGPHLSSTPQNDLIEPGMGYGRADTLVNTSQKDDRERYDKAGFEE